MIDFLRRHQSWWQGCTLVLLGLLAFWPSVAFDFVNWDDPAYIQHNDLIKSWSLSGFKGIATDVVARNYAPITIFSFLIDHTIWDMNPCGYHATNVLLHLVNGLLVFFLLRRLTGSTFIAWSTAALFLVHPVQIESVAWISSRKGLLCSLLMLSALLVRMKPAPQARDDAWYFLLLALALLSKAHAVVLPPIVLLYDILIRRYRFTKAMPGHFIPASMSLVLLLLTMGAQNAVLGGVRQHMSLGLLQIIAVDVTILWQYLGMLFWPTDLCVMYDPATAGIWRPVLIGSLAWTALACALWQIRRSQPLWILGSLSFLLLLFPMLNFFRITTLMNDRYLYLPCIVVFAMAVGVVQRIVTIAASRIQSVPKLLSSGFNAGMIASAVVACLVLTSQHLPVWRNSDSLWSHALSQYPKMPVVRIQMALTLHDSGRIPEAIQQMTLTQLLCRPDELDAERIQHFIDKWKKELAVRHTVAEGPARGELDSFNGSSN